MSTMTNWKKEPTSGLFGEAACPNTLIQEEAQANDTEILEYNLQRLNIGVFADWRSRWKENCRDFPEMRILEGELNGYAR